jgi:hypothetical protein
MEACHLVWNRAVSDCAWPVRRLKPGKLLWQDKEFILKCISEKETGGSNPVAPVVRAPAGAW